MPFLDWVNKNSAKDAAGAVPYHLLRKEAAYGDVDSENLIIQGDNLLALKALLPFYAGRVKCIFIDPPYNTKSAFEHYDDRLEHSQWLSMMYPRLVLLRELLAEDGSIWVTIDDNEAHYLKVLMDEVFGRKNFIANVAWQKKYAVKSDSEFLSESHDHVLLYGKSRGSTRIYRLPRTAAQDARYKNPDNDPRGPWTSGPLQRNEARDYAIYPIISPATGKAHMPPKGTSWRFTKEKMEELIAENRISFGAHGNNVPRLKRFLSEVAEAVPATTWWDYSDAGHNDEARREAKILQDDDDLFGTPKPERLLQKILTLSSQPTDLVLDSFLGSGTTAAVAHKMGRRYIGIEMGEHARTHCLPRLQKVIDGEQGGISKAENWQGGGGFSFLTVGEPAFDENGRLNKQIKFPTLAAYIWHVETGVPSQQEFNSPFLGIHDGKAYFLLYNGILGDRRPDGGNVLTSAVLAHLQTLCPDPLSSVIYGETTRLGPARLAAEDIIFKQIPYDVAMR
ncbi:site-specific DNA-methyltransferase [Bordetella genomosp. 12]|uniref:site-specific DNA-methyltransferase (adenine-specific) n=1 Tax=Bordetella genomosp. 12 TaxID=463035 RepID=A0A261VCU2_9BORD|nr:site-specific DNA-methyltransferase [Bordetella genomosp. 12]OZI71372.1 site-specific DNA-methyltransferase [Bordetella genomosp. 12]